MSTRPRRGGGKRVPGDRDDHDDSTTTASSELLASPLSPTTPAGKAPPSGNQQIPLSKKPRFKLTASHFETVINAGVAATRSEEYTTAVGSRAKKRVVAEAVRASARSAENTTGEPVPATAVSRWMREVAERVTKATTKNDEDEAMVLDIDGNDDVDDDDDDDLNLHVNGNDDDDDDAAAGAAAASAAAASSSSRSAAAAGIKKLVETRVELSAQHAHTITSALDTQEGLSVYNVLDNKGKARALRNTATTTASRLGLTLSKPLIDELAEPHLRRAGGAHGAAGATLINRDDVVARPAPPKPKSRSANDVSLADVLADPSKFSIPVLENKNKLLARECLEKAAQSERIAQEVRKRNKGVATNVLVAVVSGSGLDTRGGRATVSSASSTSTEKFGRLWVTMQAPTPRGRHYIAQGLPPFMRYLGAAENVEKTKLNVQMDNSDFELIHSPGDAEKSRVERSRKDLVMQESRVRPTPADVDKVSHESYEQLMDEDLFAAGADA
jgi:hypothetical protein